MIAPPPLTLFDLAVCAAVVVPFALLVGHRAAIPMLPPARGGAKLPRVSVVLAARDEAQAVGASVSSLLAQDYPDLEVITVDDRSADGTGAILREIAARDPRLRTIRIDALPAGWLGKAHALWRGADRASGDWILFTDADVIFSPDALRRAISYAGGEGLDHLTLSPLLISRGFLLRAFVAFFAYAFIALWGAYLANDPTSARGVGIGAFNLVRRDAYLAIGTMRALALRPDDDIRLGRRLRGFGFRQRVLNGREVIRVEWYGSLGAAIRGLEKSLYASLEYRVRDTIGVLALILGTMVWPYAGAILLGGVDRALLAVVIACLVAGFIETYRQAFGRLGARAAISAALLPISALCFAYAIARSAVLAERRGVCWRGTRYPLAMLRAQSGLEGARAKRSR